MSITHSENDKFYNYIVKNSTYYTMYNKNEDYEELLCWLCDTNVRDYYIDYITPAITLNSKKLYLTMLEFSKNNLILDYHVELMFKLQHFEFLDLIMLENLSYCANNLFENFVKDNMIDELIHLILLNYVNIKFINKYISKIDRFYKNPLIILIIFQYIYINNDNIDNLIEYLIFSYKLCKSYDVNPIRKMNYMHDVTKYNSNFKINYKTIKIKYDIRICNVLRSILEKICNDISLFRLFVNILLKNIGININFINYVFYIYQKNDRNIVEIFDILDICTNKYNKQTMYLIYFHSLKNINIFRNLKKIFTKYFITKDDDIMLMLIKNPIFLRCNNYISKIRKSKIDFPKCYNEIIQNTKFYNI